MPRTHGIESRCTPPIPARRMEHLWSQAGAKGGNRSQMRSARKRLKQANRQPLATRGNGSRAHGKEGVDGSSPSEGSAKAPEIGAFAFRSTCSRSNVRWVWSCLWSFRVEDVCRDCCTGVVEVVLDGARDQRLVLREDFGDRLVDAELGAPTSPSSSSSDPRLRLTGVLSVRPSLRSRDPKVADR